MSRPEEYDVVVLGSGAAGKLLAWTLASQGKRTAVIERRYVGGSCPNINCFSSKNEIWSAKIADRARHAGTFGAMTGPVKPASRSPSAYPPASRSGRSPTAPRARSSPMCRSTTSASFATTSQAADKRDAADTSKMRGKAT